MITFSIGSLITYACATTFTPGPNNVLLLSSAGQYGIKKCRSLVLGIWTGLITVMIICGFGCAFLGQVIPKIEFAARWIGAAYILYLGYKTLISKNGSKELSETESTTALTYVNGFLLQFLNVKIIMLGIAAYCSFVIPNGINIMSTTFFAIIMAASAACGNLIWLTLGGLIYPIYHKYYRLFNGIMALLLFYCVYKILFL